MTKTIEQSVKFAATPDANVPKQDHKGVSEGWPKYYWGPMKVYLKGLGS